MEEYDLRISANHSFINSFIHYGDLYSVSSRLLYSEALLTLARLTRGVLRLELNQSATMSHACMAVSVRILGSNGHFPPDRFPLDSSPQTRRVSPWFVKQQNH